MRKKLWIVLLVALMMACAALPAAAEDAALTGRWSGKANISALPFALSVTLEFSDGNLSASMTGLSASGTYTADGQTLTVTLGSLSGALSSMIKAPANIGSVALSYTVDGDSLTITGAEYGLEGTVTATRKQ